VFQPLAPSELPRLYQIPSYAVLEAEGYLEDEELNSSSSSSSDEGEAENQQRRFVDRVYIMASITRNTGLYEPMSRFRV
jgi:hypothetical protein